MQIYMRVCPICANENKRNPIYNGLYVPGWIADFSDESYADTTCDEHSDQKLIKVAMTCEEFWILCHISKEPSFMWAMNDLKEKDIIEYNVKMSQFKTQVEQQKRLEAENYPGPKCPTCNSTNIARISGVDILVDDILLGVYGTLRYKTFHCNHCGYEW